MCIRDRVCDSEHRATTYLSWLAQPRKPIFIVSALVLRRQSISRGIAMLRKTRLFTPGPTPLLPAAQNAIAAADMHHRTAEFREIFTRTLADLKTFIGTNNDVLILASSGSGAMEAAVSNLTSPGEKVVVLTAGKFGERWRDLAKLSGG